MYSEGPFIAELGYIIDIRVEFSLRSAKNDLKTSASGQ